jgi:hypothetical protein
MKREASVLDLRTVHEPANASRTASPCIGRLLPGKSGEILVEYSGNPPRPARLVARLDRHELLRPENAGREVLLVFEQGNPERPIVVDMIERPFADVLSHRMESNDAHQRDAYVDGERVVIEGRREVVLKCGEGIIVLRADGKILIKGTQLVSRSSGINRIKGGAVRIN